MSKVSQQRPIGTPSPRAAPGDWSPWIAALRLWLVAGCAICVLIPAARGVDAWFGWLPFWLVVAPAIDLLVLRRRQLTADANVWIAGLARRRASRRQARALPWRGLRHRRLQRARTGSTVQR